MKRRRLVGRMMKCTAALVAAALLFLAFVLLVPVSSIDDPTSLVLLDRRGELLGASISSDEQWRFPPIDEVPKRLETAILHFEDRRFRSHPGVDPLAVCRAIWTNLRKRRIVSGASTISMQVVRLSRKDRPRTFKEKLLEAALALRMELALDKDRILATYVSHAPYGGNVVGIEAAAWRYLGRSPQNLSWADAALLAVLPNSPALIHPGRNRDLLRARRDGLLQRLLAEEVIDEETLRLSMLEAIPEAPRPLPRTAPHLVARFGGRRAVQSGDGADRRVRTTLDSALQSRAFTVATRHRERMEVNRVHNVAAIILEAESGEVLAYVGNAADPSRAEHAAQVDCVRARRSPGSALKPLLYAGMLQEGDILPSMLVADVPIRLGGFAPENFDRTYSGAVPAGVALSRSLNVPAVRLLSEYGVDRFAALLGSLGMSTIDRPASHYGLSLVLGGGEATLFELTGIYAGLARAAAGRGEASFHPPVIELDTGVGNRSPRGSGRRGLAGGPISAGAAYLTLKALQEVERPGVDAAWRRFASSRHIAWKTGTSWGHRDAWAIGVSSRYAVGVWVGNADGTGRPGLTGHFAAAPLLMELFGLLPAEEASLEPPMSGLTTIEVCSHSGHRAGPNCGRTVSETVTTAGLRASVCPYCRIIHCDEDCTNLVHAGCEPSSSIRSESRFVLPPVMEWFHSRGNPSYRPLPPWREDCREAGAGTGPPPLSMVHPRPGARIMVPRQLGGERGRAVFTAAHRETDVSIHWHLGERYLGTTRDLHQMELAPRAGEHVLTLVDENGESIRHPFSVVE